MTSFQFTFFIPLESPDGGIYFYRTKVRNGEETLLNVSPETFSKFLIAFAARVSEVIDFQLSQTDKKQNLLQAIVSLDDLETLFENSKDIYFNMASPLGSIQVEVEYMNQLANIQCDSELIEHIVIKALLESGATRKPFRSIKELLETMFQRGTLIPADELGKSSTKAYIQDRVKEAEASREIKNPFTAILESCDVDPIDFLSIALDENELTIKVGDAALRIAPDRHTIFEIHRLRSGLFHLLRGVEFPTRSMNEDQFGPEVTQNLAFSFEIGRPAESIRPAIQLLVGQVSTNRRGATFAVSALFGQTFHSCQVTAIDLLDFITDLRELERSLIHLIKSE